MKFMSLGLIALILLQGCVSGKNLLAAKKLERLTAGMTEERVVDIVGPPDKRFDLDEERFVLYYRTRQSSKNSENREKDFTAVSFEEGRVITIGQDLSDLWEPKPVEKKQVPPDKLKAAQHKARIQALEAMVRPVPVSDAEKNLRLYRELLRLEPDNQRYQQKVNFYQERLDAQMKSEPTTFEKKDTDASEKKVSENKPLPEERSQSKNSLKKTTVEIEVVNIGNKTYFIWIKNFGEAPLSVASNMLAIMDSNKKVMPINLSSELTTDIAPGDTATGEIVCHGDGDPAVLIFTHEATGSMVKILD